MKQKWREMKKKKVMGVLLSMNMKNKKGMYYIDYCKPIVPAKGRYVCGDLLKVITFRTVNPCMLNPIFTIDEAGLFMKI